MGKRSKPVGDAILDRADLAIAVYYRPSPWPFTLFRYHRLFRFVARFDDGRVVAWDKQPSEALEPDFDKLMTMLAAR